jgi:hypothetical protein
MRAPGMEARPQELCWSAPCHRRPDNGFQRAARSASDRNDVKASVNIQPRLFFAGLTCCAMRFFKRLKFSPAAKN